MVSWDPHLIFNMFLLKSQSLWHWHVAPGKKRKSTLIDLNPLGFDLWICFHASIENEIGACLVLCPCAHQLRFSYFFCILFADFLHVWILMSEFHFSGIQNMFSCISYAFHAFLMHFLFISYIFLMHFLCAFMHFFNTCIFGYTNTCIKKSA